MDDEALHTVHSEYTNSDYKIFIIVTKQSYWKQCEKRVSRTIYKGMLFK